MAGLNIWEHMCVLVAVLLTLIASPGAHAQSAQYEAVLSDGTRLEGSRLTGWHAHNSVPHLKGVRLSDGNRQLLWFRNCGVRPHNPSSNRLGFVEFVGGDRFVGRVLGLTPSSKTDGLYVPAHLLVKPAKPLHVPGYQPLAHVRILPGHIQRVAWGRASQRRLQPGTLYYADGRQLGFLRLRWQQDSVLLLLKNGTRQVKLSEIAEVHLAKIDPWQAYYQELAVLSPACRSRLVRFETTGGLIVTGSALRFRAAPYGTPQEMQRAVDHIKRLDEQIGKMNAQRPANQQRFERARAIHSQHSTASANQKKAAHQANQKALAEMKLRIDNLRKGDAAQFTKKRQQLEQEFRAAEQAMQQRLANVPAQKRDKELNAFRQKQAQSRKKRETLLEAERLKLEKQRKRELDTFTKSQTDKLTKLELELQKKMAPYERVLKAEASRWERYLKHLESVKSQRASARGPQGYPGSWYHMVQPAWSLDPLWVLFGSIHMRWSFAPVQVPLSRVHPAAAVSPSLLPWHTNRNSAGGLLRSGRQHYGWGFAVHAYSELSFTLPQCVKSFRSRLGLDRLVGAGGCVRARVYVGSTKAKALYQSPLLIGSEKIADTGKVQLPLPAEGPKHLVLQVDPAHDNRPRGADPLNIRDKLDWLDPQLELDVAKLQKEVRRQVGPQIVAWQGWKLALDKRGVYSLASDFDESSGAGRFVTMVRAQGQPLTLSREMTIAPGDNWLVVHVGLPAGQSLQANALTLRVGRQEVQPRKTPTRQRWQRGTLPVVFPIAQYLGMKVTLELKQQADGKPLHWRGVGTSEELPWSYRLANILALDNKSDLQVNYGFGRALLSGQVKNQEKFAALAIHQFGGVVNFWNWAVTRISYDELSTVLIGCDWKGGDKALMSLTKMPSLKMLLVAKDSGVSSGAIAKIQAAMPNLTIAYFERTPSNYGNSCSFTVRNRTGKDVSVLWVHYRGHLQNFCNLKPGEDLKRGSREGFRFEAHYLAKNYAASKPISKFVCTAPDSAWEIKP